MHPALLQLLCELSPRSLYAVRSRLSAECKRSPRGSKRKGRQFSCDVQYANIRVLEPAGTEVRSPDSSVVSMCYNQNHFRGQTVLHIKVGN